MNERCPLIFGETWRPITKLSVPKVKENMYFVSDRGRVISRSIHRKRVTRTDISSQYDF